MSTQPELPIRTDAPLFEIRAAVDVSAGILTPDHPEVEYAI